MEQLSEFELQQVSGGGAVGFFSGAVVGAIGGGLAGGPFGFALGFWLGGLGGSELENVATQAIEDAVNSSGGTTGSSGVGGSGPTVVVRS